jgi:DUF2075 family protein
MNWAQMSKQNLNLWLKSRNKEILSTILLNRISHLALERVLRIQYFFLIDREKQDKILFISRSIC